MSPSTYVAPVAEMHCMTGYPPKSGASASFRGDMPLDAGPSTAEANLATRATCENPSDIKATTVAYESKIERILAHQNDPGDDTCFRMHVRWEGGTESWVPEIYIQKHCAPTLFAYWNSVEGGREGVMEDPGLWHVFRIISHKRGSSGNVRFHVAWVGSPQYSWEAEATVKDANSGLVEQYWDSQDGRRKAVRRSVRSKNYFGGETRAMDSKSKMRQMRRDQAQRRIANKRRKLEPR
ncbi:chromo domain-containing protein [Colletotrichum kahawae]|uniref:Chromo domain-containing protein n=1 Tax=Colletotrichum kahawae TaxID=34407 RepID=A0AAD9YJ95_COLKA|nr:chromo domain-containing protein [Colletotrichum kahawae]